MRRQPKIPDIVKELDPIVAKALKDIEPSIAESRLRMFPCEIELDTGERDSHVYLVEAAEYINSWGVWPWDDRYKKWVPAERIRHIRSSPVRLSPRFANVLYKAGESGMGYCAFSVDLRDGRKLYYVMGNAIDYPAWPDGVTPEDVVAVNPHDRNPQHKHRQPSPNESETPFAWAPFRRRA